MFLIASFVVFTLLGFTGVAYAADGAGDVDWGSLLGPVLDAFRGGQYPVAAALALVVAVAVVKHYGARKWPWLESDVAGSLLALLGSFGAAAATAFAAGGLHWATAWAALKVAAIAAGGYSLLKPLVRLAEEKAPAWLRPAFALIMWVFDKPARDAKAEAEAAGDAAVVAHPAAGLDAIVGPPRDVP